MGSRLVVCLSVVLMMICGISFAEGERADVTTVSCKGHLDRDALSHIHDQLVSIQDSSIHTLIIDIDSTSGDLLSVLDIARELYELKVQNGIHIIAYIRENALGPAAILPFVADERIISFFISWGDVISDREPELPINILRSRVKSMISPTDSQYAILSLFAEAMIDPSLVVVDDGGWKARERGVDYSGAIISREGETLVVNHNQVTNQLVGTVVMTPDELYDSYKITRQQKEVFEKQPSDASALPISSETVQQKIEEHIHYDPKGANRVGRIVIDDMTSGINQSTWIYVRNALEYYKELKPSFIILELNTPGGEVFSAQKISDALKEFDTQYNIPVVAYVNNWAISAGAMLAYSCRFIAIAKDASMGAAEPVFASAEGMTSAPEKVNSALRTDFANRAGFFDRNPVIAEAMVDKDAIVVIRHGKIIKLDDEEQIRFDAVAPDIIVSAKGKLLTLDAKRMMEYGVADMMILPRTVAPLTDEEKGSGIWQGRKSLLLSDEYFAHIPSVTIETYQMDWKAKFFAVLASPMVSSLLFLGLMIGFYTEFTTPGFGFPGIVGITCLFFIILSSFSLEAANWLEVIFLFAGISFLALEIFILPGFGIAGIIGIIFSSIGLLGIMLPGIHSLSFDFDSQTFNAAGEAVFERLLWLLGSLLTGIIAIAFMSRYIVPRFKAFNRLVLEGEERRDDGYVAGLSPDMLPPIGSVGIVEASLRPSGKVLIDDIMYDAMGQGCFIEKGQSIIVTAIEGSRLMVEEKHIR